MVKRHVVVAPVVDRPASYFPDSFISSGSFLLDCVLGGGWARGRVINIVGDKSSGKTLLAIEACANFARKYNAVDIRYVEPENAFLRSWAEAVGFPPGVRLTEEGKARIDTVEAYYEDVVAFLKDRVGAKRPCMHILDSLDALSDDAEHGRAFGESTWGVGKPKAISEMFRRLIGDIRDADCLLVIISQIRDNIGVTFGETKKRSGGRALDFYASQVLWLAETSKIKRTVLGVDRVIGTSVLARTKKNKVGIPFRETELVVIFNYGFDDEASMINWLVKHKAIDLLGITDKDARKLLSDARHAHDPHALFELRESLRAAVYKHWQHIESELAPTVRKY